MYWVVLLRICGRVGRIGRVFSMINCEELMGREAAAGRMDRVLDTRVAERIKDGGYGWAGEVWFFDTDEVDVRIQTREPAVDARGVEIGMDAEIGESCAGDDGEQDQITPNRCQNLYKIKHPILLALSILNSPLPTEYILLAA
jgi:hypothetical protein